MKKHQQMDLAWKKLAQQLRAIVDGSGQSLSASDVQPFAATYHAHMEREETQIATMAKRLFSDEQMQRLGNAMRTRRGLSQKES